MVYWDNLEDMVNIGPKMPCNMETQLSEIMRRFKSSSYRKYIVDPNHILDMENLHTIDTLTIEVKPIQV